MRDQEIELACLGEEGSDLRPMRLRYGSTANDASHSEPLQVTLDQEEPEESLGDEGIWSEVDSEEPPAESTRSSLLPDDLDEPQVSPAAEHDAMHIIDS